MHYLNDISVILRFVSAYWICHQSPIWSIRSAASPPTEQSTWYFINDARCKIPEMSISLALHRNIPIIVLAHAIAPAESSAMESLCGEESLMLSVSKSCGNHCYWQNVLPTKEERERLGNSFPLMVPTLCLGEAELHDKFFLFLCVFFLQSSFD